MLVVGRAALVRRIIADFPEAQVIPIYVRCDHAKRKSHLEAAGHESTTVAKKLSRDHDPVLELHKHEELYRDVLLNDSTLNVFLHRIEALVLKYVGQ